MIERLDSFLCFVPETAVRDMGSSPEEIEEFRDFLERISVKKEKAGPVSGESEPA
jgi:hypothetical protein